MNYIVEYEICALLFLLIVTFRFFGMRKFQNRSNHIFGLIMCCGIMNLSLDIVSSFAINNKISVPLWANYALNTGFYALQIALPAVMLLYVLVLSGKELPKTVYISLAPAIISEILILINPFNGLFFYFKNNQYTHGRLLPLLYIISALYFAATLFVVVKFRHNYRKTESRTIILFVLFISAALTTQIIFPKYLITGVAISVSIFLMFLTMQNPETMLDSITGTFNYSALTEYLRRQISEGKPMWISAVDVGGLRRINSTLGIRIGNEILESVGKFINETGGTHSKAFRMIGTRFIIISENSKTHYDNVKHITDRFKMSWVCEKDRVILPATVRYCEQVNSFTTPEDVLNLIDLAYSKTGEEGFGNTKAVDMQQLELLRRKGQVKEAISRALESDDGLYLNYQPLYSIKEKRFCGAEALIRLNDPVLGSISPAEFIPIAEDSDLIYRIDRLVVRKVCNFIKSNPRLFDGGMRVIEINLSATEFNQDTEKLFHEIVTDIESIEDRICFEVTETAVTSRREILSDFMHRLIDRGVRFAIDDFGTGYANITQLAKLPFSIVKLDKIFVSQNNLKETMILKDLVNMFDHIGLLTVFEGVETEQQAEFASKLGVAQIQGYYYSHPLSEDELIKLMTREAEQHKMMSVCPAEA